MNSNKKHTFIYINDFFYNQVFHVLHKSTCKMKMFLLNSCFSTI